MKLVLETQQKRDFIKNIINQANNHFVSVSFTKKDGTDRTMQVQYAAMFSRLKGDEAVD